MIHDKIIIIFILSKCHVNCMKQCISDFYISVACKSIYHSLADAIGVYDLIWFTVGCTWNGIEFYGHLGLHI